MFGFLDFFTSGDVFSRVILFCQLWSVGTIQSLLFDLINTWLSGCKMLGLLNCWNAVSSVIQVFSAVCDIICEMLPSVSSPAHIPTVRNPFASVHTGFYPHYQFGSKNFNVCLLVGWSVDSSNYWMSCHDIL